LDSDNIKDVVHISADAVGGFFQVEKLDIVDPLVQLALGVIIAKASTTRCTVQIQGLISGIYTGLTAGRPLFIGNDSRLTHTVPTRPASGIRLLYPAALALASDVLLLRFQTPGKLVA
jgi:hypothetical protein